MAARVASDVTPAPVLTAELRGLEARFDALRPHLEADAAWGAEEEDAVKGRAAALQALRGALNDALRCRGSSQRLPPNGSATGLACSTWA